MARKKKSEGAEVREAFDGPAVDHDTLIDFASARNVEDRERASSAGESRALIGTFLEETSLNSKALSWARSIMKKADMDRAKAMDIIRSLEVVLPMVKAHVSGQSTPDMFPDEPDLSDGAVVPVAEFPTRPSYSPDIQDETDAFEKNLAAVAG